MSISLWAEREIEILKNNNKSDDSFDYVGGCCDSALKALKSLMDDGHSGMSIGITKGILNKLIDGKPLTPIEDTEDIWNECGCYGENDRVKHYQCKRMSALFKDVYPDGRVEYKDVNRSRGVDVDNPNSCYSNRSIAKLIDDMFPIVMPYAPSEKPYIVYCEDFLTDKSKGDYDTRAYLYMITPSGEKIELNKFYHEFNASEPMKEISKEEYEKLKSNRL
ncbi:MAG: hypothetical protein ACRDB0_05080 [Paraclostridium sp.]